MILGSALVMREGAREEKEKARERRKERGVNGKGGAVIILSHTPNHKTLKATSSILL